MRCARPICRGGCRVAGESFPGRGYEAPLDAGQCVRIFTGGAGSRRRGPGRDPGGGRPRRRRRLIFEAPGPARHIRARGSDFARGDVLLEPGRLLDARALVAAAGADLAEVEVWRRPRLVMIGTGDELVAPGTRPRRRRARSRRACRSASPLSPRIGAPRSSRAGGSRDDLPTLEREAAEALTIADVVVVTGGASVGERDYAKAMFEPAGLELIFSKVAIKPGKPVWLGRAGDALVIGLPGNPNSALVTARLLLAPLLAGLTGRAPALALAAGARWPRHIAATGNRETFYRAAAAGDARAPALQPGFGRAEARSPPPISSSAAPRARRPPRRASWWTSSTFEQAPRRAPDRPRR